MVNHICVFIPHESCVCVIRKAEFSSSQIVGSVSSVTQRSRRTSWRPYVKTSPLYSKSKKAIVVQRGRSQSSSWKIPKLWTTLTEIGLLPLTFRRDAEHREANVLLRALVEAEIDGVAVSNQLTALKETIDGLENVNLAPVEHLTMMGCLKGGG